MFAQLNDGPFQFQVVVTAHEADGPTQASTSPLTLADVDQMIDVLFSQSQPADSWYISMERYQQIVWAYRRAQKRAGTIAQKERAQWKRRHREQKKARAALVLQYRRRS